MPMYFPDLKSVQKLAQSMTKHREEDKKYKGIIPQTEEDLPQARKELELYLLNVWHDTIFAAEVAMAVDENNYHEKIREYIFNRYYDIPWVK